MPLKNLPVWRPTAQLIAASSLMFAAMALPSSAKRQDAVLKYPIIDNAVCKSNASENTPYALRGNWGGSAAMRVEQNVVINRQIYKSDYRIRASEKNYTILVCKVDNKEFNTLSLRLGIADKSADRNEKMTVQIYQSGSVISTYTPTKTKPGSIMNVLIDLQNRKHSNPGNIAVELKCERSSYGPGCYLFFLGYELSPTAPMTNFSTGSSSKLGSKSAREIKPEYSPSVSQSSKPAKKRKSNSFPDLGKLVTDYLGNVVEDLLKFD